MNKHLKRILQIIFSIVFWLSIWAAVSYKINETFLLPTPKEVFFALGDLIKDVDFFLICIKTFGRIIYGILIAILLGILMGVITTKISFIDLLITPLMSAVKSTPVASFIILAILWFERDILPVFITVLIVLPIVWTNIGAGIRSVDKELLDVAKIYRFGTAKRIRRLYLPSIMPYFLAACRSALGMAWKAGIAAEVLCTPKEAIGTELYLSKTYLETPTMFAWTLVIIILSFIIEKVFIYLITKLSKRLSHSSIEVSV